MRGAFLLEIGCEEIPARMIPAALEQLRAGLARELGRERIPAKQVASHGTPRRLVVRAEGLPARQPDEETVVTGPAVAAAYDAGGRPTRAAIGFARAQGVAPGALERIRKSKREHVAARKKVPGRDAREILAEIVPRLLDGMNFPKAMRWGSGEKRFVRPVRWIVALLGTRPVEFQWAGIAAGRGSRGHRRRKSPPFRIPSAGTYGERIRRQGILLDPEERRRRLLRQLHAAARRLGGSVVEDPELVETVVHLVEMPLVIAGRFGEEFLQLPDEVLRTSMRHHQKCFSVRSADGRLRNAFLAVADAEDDPEGTIRRGNEWVLRARLTDARFFWEEDCKLSLEARRDELRRITFHKDLGSFHDKVERVTALCQRLAGGREVGLEDLRTACRLARCDLPTHLVGEFPELQGIMGGLYARRSGLSDTVCEAIYDQYLPRSLDDPVPRRLEGALLGIADRLDTLAGFFLLDALPSGSRDPYGLRRAAQGICKIAMETGMRASLAEWVEAALERQAVAPARGDRAEVAERLLGFLHERLAYVLEARGFAADTVEAVLQAGADDPADALRRAEALEAIRRDPDFEALAIGFKRVRNILAGQEEVDWDPEALQEPAERALHDRYLEARQRIEPHLRDRAYPEVLREVAAMRGSIDRFFDEVLVMTREEAIRRNRLGLLQTLSRMFLRIADFSCMAAETAARPGGGK